MKYIAILIVCFASTTAFADADVFKCKFAGEKGRSCHATAVVIENGGVAPGAPAPATVEKLPAKLFIDCGKGFRFSDREAKAVEKENGVELIWVWGHDDGVKAQLLLIEIENGLGVTEEEERLIAYLTIENGREVTFRGRCVEVENDVMDFE